MEKFLFRCPYCERQILGLMRQQVCAECAEDKGKSIYGEQTLEEIIREYTPKRKRGTA